MRLPTLLSIAAMSATFAGAQENQLTADETAAGYDLPFNGSASSLQGNWHGYRTSLIPDTWEVKTNSPLGPRIENKLGNTTPILTNKKYTNFDLKIDVQVPIKANSGIFSRYEETAPSPADRRSGPEMQICETSHPDCGSPKNGFGACYDMFPVASSLRTTWYNPTGSWNQMRIIAYDSNYVHYGNGKKLLEYKIGTQEYLTAYNASKYVSDGNNGRYYHIHPGSILLQHHGEAGITFRNIKIKELTTHPFKKEFSNGAWPETLPQSFVFGKDPSATLAAVRIASAAIRTRHAGSEALQVLAPADHSSFQALGLDGRAVPFRKSAEGVYLLDLRHRASGVVVIKVKVEGRILSKVVGLP